MKRPALPLAAAISLFITGPSLAEEVNPFQGAHGSVEALRLETERTNQQNELLKAQIELLRNKAILASGGIDLRAPSSMPPPVKPGTDEADKAPAPPPPPVKVPAPRQKTVLTSVIDTSKGRQAIVTQGGRTWTLSVGDRFGRAVVKRIDPHAIVLSDKRVLRLAPEDFAVAGSEGGSLAAAGGGMSSELRDILRVTGPSPSLPVIRPVPVPAKIN